MSRRGLLGGVGKHRKEKGMIDNTHAVVVLPSKVVQIQAVSHPGDINCGPHVQLFALCDDGSVWCQYQSSGASNVPTDGRWYSALNIERKTR